MNPPTFPYTDAELENAGLLGEGESLSLLARLGRAFQRQRGYSTFNSLQNLCHTYHLPIGVSESAKRVIQTMREHPDLLSEYFKFFPRHTALTTFYPDLSLFALQCINTWSRLRSTPTLSHSSTMSSRASALAFASDSTTVSQYGPDEYERLMYYNGIADQPNLVYRSDFLTPFPMPIDRHAFIPVKSVHGVFDTPLNSVWDIVRPQIGKLLNDRQINWSAINPARFLTHAQPGEEAKGSLGPVVIWVGVFPGSTSSDIAHEVSQDILALLLKNGVKDVVVEWEEGVAHWL